MIVRERRSLEHGSTAWLSALALLMATSAAADQRQTIRRLESPSVDGTRAGWQKFEKNPVLGGKLGTCFDVTVLKVNVINVPAKRSRRWQSRQVKVRKGGYKKAIITLAPDDSIDIFEGVK
jgi:hypothetical protein